MLTEDACNVFVPIIRAMSHATRGERLSGSESWLGRKTQRLPYELHKDPGEKRFLVYYYEFCKVILFTIIEVKGDVMMLSGTEPTIVQSTRSYYG